MQLKSLTNEAVLFSGYYQDGSNVYVKLGGEVYLFSEDPDDGYRSYMIEEGVVTAPPKARFSFAARPVVLFARYTNNGSFTGLELFLTEDSTDPVAQFGTDLMDDYYPCAISYVDVAKINEEFFHK
jgi:hypothetical protein